MVKELPRRLNSQPKLVLTLSGVWVLLRKEWYLFHGLGTSGWWISQSLILRLTWAFKACISGPLFTVKGSWLKMMKFLLKANVLSCLKMRKILLPLGSMLPTSYSLSHLSWPLCQKVGLSYKITRQKWDRHVKEKGTIAWIKSRT